MNGERSPREVTETTRSPEPPGGFVDGKKRNRTIFWKKFFWIKTALGTWGYVKFALLQKGKKREHNKERYKGAAKHCSRERQSNNCIVCQGKGGLNCSKG